MYFTCKSELLALENILGNYKLGFVNVLTTSTERIIFKKFPKMNLYFMINIS